MSATEKRYFWLKLKEDFFDDKQTRYLRSLPDGDKVLITYLKMQLKSLKTAGTIRYDRILPSSEEELALLLDEDINIVKFTIKKTAASVSTQSWRIYCIIGGCALPYHVFSAYFQ